jgi:gamma-glutamyltranspeptidase/glutathione hydrolase
MAATAQPLASQIAIDILKAGGTAVDAAIAANAALGLMEPTGNGIGGDLFAIVWDPKTAKLHGLNASGRSPQSRSLERLKEQLAGADSIPPLGHLPVTVPGTVDGWFELHQRFGNLPMQKVLAPAIQYAKEGFPVSPVIAYYFQRAEAAFNRRLAMIDEFDNAKRTYFTPRAPKPVRSSATPTWLRLTAKSPARAETFSIRAPSPKPSTPTCSVLAATYAWPTLSPTKVNG